MSEIEKKENQLNKIRDEVIKREDSVSEFLNIIKASSLIDQKG